MATFSLIPSGSKILGNRYIAPTGGAQEIVTATFIARNNGSIKREQHRFGTRRKGLSLKYKRSCISEMMEDLHRKRRADQLREHRAELEMVSADAQRGAVRHAARRAAQALAALNAATQLSR